MEKHNARMFKLILHMVIWLISYFSLIAIDINYRRDFIYSEDLINISCEGGHSYCIISKATPDEIKIHLGYKPTNSPQHSEEARASCYPF